MSVLQQVSVFLLSCLCTASLWSSELLRLEGYLREMQKGTNEGYVLFPSTSTELLLPNGLVRHISFVLVELPDEYISCANKYVVIEGQWQGMYSPIFDNIAILKAKWVTDDHWTNMDYPGEEAHDFFDEHVMVLAEGAFAVARFRALKSGFTLLEAEDNWLIEVHPDGTKIPVRPLRKW